MNAAIISTLVLLALFFTYKCFGDVLVVKWLSDKCSVLNDGGDADAFDVLIQASTTRMTSLEMLKIYYKKKSLRKEKEISLIQADTPGGWEVLHSNYFAYLKKGDEYYCCIPQIPHKYDQEEEKIWVKGKLYACTTRLNYVPSKKDFDWSNDHGKYLKCMGDNFGNETAMKSCNASHLKGAL